jgi:hypothetical protein
MNLEIQTEFKFSELSDSAKDIVRQAYRGDYYPYDDWWDNVYEDAVRMGALMGINISTTVHKARTPGHSYKTTDIYFSGFCSQDDGACFEGNYRFVPNAVQKVKAETNDEELIRIAIEISTLQVTRRLLGLEPFSASISTRGNYSHSGTMNITIDDPNIDDDHRPDAALRTEKDDITQLMRSFADWIYKSLEADYDYLTSDECIDQYLEDGDEKYDEFGSVI